MAQKILKVTLISARDLKDVNFLSKMEVYAVVSIDGDARTRQRTPTDRSGSTSPSWNVELRFPFDPAGALHVLLRAERALGDRDVGEVHIPLRELLVGAAGEKASAGHPQFVSYQVRKPGSAKPKGSLNISYTVIDAASNVPYPTPAASSPATAYPPPSKAAKPNEPVTAYPAAASATATAHPYPAPAGYPSYPPPPPPQYGYGAPPHLLQRGTGIRWPGMGTLRRRSRRRRTSLEWGSVPGCLAVPSADFSLVTWCPTRRTRPRTTLDTTPDSMMPAASTSSRP